MDSWRDPPRAENGDALPRRGSLVDGAVQAVRSWLAPGRYREGDRLPPEHELAGMLGISRGTLRTALGQLADTGEIVRRQGSGTYVGQVTQARAFGHGLEPLESYALVAGGVGALTAADVRIERGVARPEAGHALGLGPDSASTMITRTMLGGGRPVAVMHDVVHPEVALPEDAVLRGALEHGQTLLDVLREQGVPVTFSRTAIVPALLSGDDGHGRALGLTRTCACLELEEVIYAGRGVGVAYSRDVFAPEAIEVMVMRSVDAPRPMRVGEPGSAAASGPVAGGAAS